MLTQEVKPKKAKRVSKACDFCHSRSIRCRPSAEEGTARCQNCFDYQHPCRYTRPTLKRGTRARQDAAKAGSATASDSAAGPSQSPGQWQSPDAASHAVIVDLVEVYFDVVYPLFPFFHRDTTLARVANAEYESNKAFFVCVMAVCAVSSGRVRDGALYKPHANLDQMRRTAPDTYFDLAHQHLPKDSRDLEISADLDVLRAFALLAIAALQQGHTRNFRWYLGTYLMVTQVDNLHIEAKWPRNIPSIEREERRRLFWSMYSLDVFSAAVFDTIVTLDDEECQVSYPLEMEDGAIAALDSEQDPPSNPLVPSMTPHWLAGWNAYTDISRAMALAIKQIRLQKSHSSGRGPTLASLEFVNAASRAKFSEAARRIEQLPPALREPFRVTGNPDRDCYSFQAVHLITSFEFLKIKLFCAQNAPIDQRCAIAVKFLHDLDRIPLDYSRAISTPLLYLVAGLGASLLSDGSPRSPALGNVRSVLGQLTEWVNNVEAGMMSAKGATERLRAQVLRLDDPVNFATPQALPSHARPPPPAPNLSSMPPHFQPMNPVMQQRGLHPMHPAEAQLVPGSSAMFDNFYMPMGSYDPDGPPS